jgi:hypothetical protein
MILKLNHPWFFICYVVYSAIGPTVAPLTHSRLSEGDVIREATVDLFPRVGATRPRRSGFSPSLLSGLEVRNVARSLVRARGRVSE